VGAMTGATARTGGVEAVLDADCPKRPGRAHAVRCRVQARADGLHATPTGPQGSHILTSMLGADALAMIPSERGDVRRGERVRLVALPGRTLALASAEARDSTEAPES